MLKQLHNIYRSLSTASDLSDGNLNDVTLWDGVNNMLTGNVDYARSMDMANADRTFNAEQNALAREFNSAEAKKQRDWQEQMAKQQYSMAIEDMKRNGINPYSSAGQSANFGSGSSASVSAIGSGGHSAHSIGNGLVGIISSALNAYSASENRKIDLLRLEQSKIDNELARQLKMQQKHKYRTVYDGKGNLLREIFDD